VRVEELELGRGAVLFELGLPGFGVLGEHGAGHGAPLGDAQARGGGLLACVGSKSEGAGNRYKSEGDGM
jgi:hypothetical protein